MPAAAVPAITKKFARVASGNIATSLPARSRRRASVMSGPAFGRVAATSGIMELPTAYRAPRQNAACQRFLGRVRRAGLDQLLALGEAHLRRVLREYARYFNRDGPHQGLGQRSPDAPEGRRRRVGPCGDLRAVSILGGLHHAYASAA